MFERSPPMIPGTAAFDSVDASVARCGRGILRPSFLDDSMDAERINAIAATLADLAQRAAELRRYL